MEQVGQAQSVALLLTDAVGSTQLAQQLGEEASARLGVRHDRLARDLLAHHGGREVDKSDGFLLLFDDAANAMAYAEAYHRMLAGLEPPMSARAGLHVGRVVLVDNRADDVARGAKPLEVQGVAKSVAARVMAVAQGGQTLLTAAARQALVDDLPTVCHGHWRMKGLPEPVELFEVRNDEASMEPPPDADKAWRVVRRNDTWVPVREVRHSLPAEYDAFVGRRAGLLALADLTDDGVRLVSVTGIGGTGKTRLALHFGWTWLGDYPGGVWFCDLSEARSVDGIVYAVAAALDVPLGKGDPVVQLGHAIAGRGRCLVVLDNFEQVARHAKGTLGHWVGRASDATFIVTTREVLGLPGEVAFALAPLAEEDSFDLFETRAAAAHRGFRIEPKDQADVEALVALLDHLPLAIELAAARVRVLSPQALLERMSERFRLLRSSGARIDRQATLRATLDWSWELLSVDEQAALAQLSVFEGGFTLPAAEAVLVLDDAWPLDAVQSLVDKSLVRKAEHDRFDLLVSVQLYASERLDDRGDRRATEKAHGSYYAQLGIGEAIESLSTHGGPDRRRSLQRELDNVVAAFRRAASHEEAEIAVATLRAAWEVVRTQGPIALGAELASAALDSIPAMKPELQAKCHEVCGRSHTMVGRKEEACTQFQAALTIHADVGDGRAAGVVLNYLGCIQRDGGQLEDARALLEQALTLLRHAGDRHREAPVLLNLGLVASAQGFLEEARAHADASLAMGAASGNLGVQAGAHGCLDTLDGMEGAIDQGREHLTAALTLARRNHDRQREGGFLANMASEAMMVGPMQDVRRLLDEALVIARETGGRQPEAHALHLLGNLHRGHGEAEPAQAHLDAAQAIFREIGSRRSVARALVDLGRLQLQRGLLDGAIAHLEDALATFCEIGDPHGEGVARCEIGHAYTEAGDPARARVSWEAGEAHLRRLGAGYDLAAYLAGRAEREAATDSQKARAHFAEAEEIAERVGATPDSQIGRLLARARSALADLQTMPPLSSVQADG